MKRLFGAHVVQTGLIEAGWGAFLGETSDPRLTANYYVETLLAEAAAREECNRAKAVLIRIREILLAAGFTPEEFRAEILAC